MTAQNNNGKYSPSAKSPFGQPDPKFEEFLKDYEKLIGLCDCVSVQMGANQQWGKPVNTVWEWKYVMNGKAIQDINRREDGSSSSSIRLYNADSAQWYVTYFSGNLTSTMPSTWVSRKGENPLVLYLPQKAPNGFDGFSRLTFQNITDQGFEWRGAWVDPTGSAVFPFWKIDCKKRN